MEFACFGIPHRKNDVVLHRMRLGNLEEQR